jgi:uncharacterized RDD family membrane protein YckC
VSVSQPDPHNPQPQSQPSPNFGYQQSPNFGAQQSPNFGAQQSPNFGSQQSPATAPNPYATGANTVPSGSVAGAVAEYIDIPGRGAVRLASVSQRFLARLIDSVILGVVITIILSIGMAIFIGGLSTTSFDESGNPTSGTGAGIGFGAIFLCGFIAIVILYAYEAVMIGFWGATLGKMIMKVKVVKPRNGSVPGIGAGVVRYLIPGVCALIPFIGWIGTLLCFLSVTFDSSGRRQGWHDKVANTVVVSTAV